MTIGGRGRNSEAADRGGNTTTSVSHRDRFERIFRDEYGAVLRYAAMRADLDLAKDAAAQTFLVAWRRRDELPDAPRAWLLGVTRRTLADLKRSRRRQAEVRSRLSAVGAVESASPYHLNLESDQGVVRVALSQLRDGDAEILRLVYWDELSCGQAAEVLGCSTPAAKVRLFRARGALRQTLEQLDRVGGPVRPECGRARDSTSFRARSSEEAS